MKRLFLLIIALLCLCECERYPDNSLLESRSSSFDNALSLASFHSEGLAYAYNQGCFQNKKVNSEQIVKEFLLSKNCFSQLTKDNIDGVLLATRNNFQTKTKSENSIIEDIWSEIIIRADDFTPDTDYSKEIRSIILQDKYINCEDSVFETIALLGAIYVDSITYWHDNFASILYFSPTKAGDVEGGGWDWDVFWYDLKEIAKADGKGAFIGAFFGPEVMLVSALLESIDRMEEVAEEYYENKNS